MLLMIKLLWTYRSTALVVVAAATPSMVVSCGIRWSTTHAAAVIMAYVAVIVIVVVVVFTAGPTAVVGGHTGTSTTVARPRLCGSHCQICT
jgi:hypothetical protein